MAVLKHGKPQGWGLSVGPHGCQDWEQTSDWKLHEKHSNVNLKPVLTARVKAAYICCTNNGRGM